LSDAAGCARIEYRFILPDGSQETFTLELEADGVLRRSAEHQPLPGWTALEFHQCAHCPLAVAQTPGCPAAGALVSVVGRMDHLVSFDELELEVRQAGRTLRQGASAQEAISSLLGLLMATSGCPHTGFLRPMARFHQPLADELETTYRSTSMYLLAQYFRHRDGLAPDLDLDGLSRAYAMLHEVNEGMVKRLRAASRTDSTLNAVVILDLYTLLLPEAIGEALENIRPLFASYFASY
jgi:hypothetical protein